MAVKVRIRKPTGKIFSSSIILRSVLIAVVLGAAIICSVFAYFYFKYQGIVDARLKEPLFANTAKIYAAPRELRPGQKLSVQLITNELRNAGYTGQGAPIASPLGTFTQGVQNITVRPGPQSFHSEDEATIHLSGGKVQSITDDKGQELSSYELEPLLITGLSEDANRTKRRLLTYEDIPPNLVHAVVAIEDRRFFEHGGVDYIRMIGALVNDIKPGHRWTEGGSTLTMQLARGFFLTPERKIKRKLIEILITFQLEHRFTKQQIFAMYANEIPLGQRGSFAIDGFGEASQAYFGKDVRGLTLPECALLAGIIQSPNRLNPFRHPERAIERRNIVLDSMVETGAITKEQSETAKAEPLHLQPGSVDAREAPYFVDLVRDQHVQKLGDRDYNREGLRIYTSLDPDLQRVATEAINSTVHEIDTRVERLYARRKKRGENVRLIYPQVALVALNPHTGQVLALVGGRDYGNSQLNRAVAQRPTGSTFKPFVYAAAFNSAVQGITLTGLTKPFTQVTMLNDQQTTYDLGNGQEYTPRNMEGVYHDQVTARYALQKSLNNATIGLAAMIGFDQVAALARDAGIKNARGTPAMAIGAYDATPLDLAGSYTIFANGGVHLDPWTLASVRTATGDIINDYTPSSRQVLDPRVAFLATDMMENVINHGTAEGVRARGFTAPAAGKTGTEHDSWFAGYTTNLLCVVWVGNDDYTDLKIEGADAAAPVWAEFMKKAVLLPQYSDTNAFTPPEGIDIVKLDKVSNLLADETCPDDYNAGFLTGTAPDVPCDHPLDHRNIFQKIFGLGSKGN
jgi:penicillin-binding protein 1B